MTSRVLFYVLLKGEFRGKIDVVKPEQAGLIKSKDERIADLTKQLDAAKHKIHEQQEKDEEIK